jgi:rhamnose transport system ATP-binding protein
MTPLVELAGVSKSFGPVRVLNGISFDVRPGEVHALLGENGAGKSTLIKIIAGVQTADAGEIRVEGRPVRFSSPREAAAQGIATVYQELLLFPELSVAENIYIGHAPRTRWGSVDWSAMRAGARALLDSLDSHDLDVDAIVGRLSVANRQRVEIAKALSQNAKLVIMDEPTAALGVAQTEQVLGLIKRLSSQGTAVMMVSHNLVDVFAVAEQISILYLGRLVAQGPASDFDTQMVVEYQTTGQSTRANAPGVEAP